MKNYVVINVNGKRIRLKTIPKLIDVKYEKYSEVINENRNNECLGRYLFE